jgi:FAD:protein FMN transferase
MTQPQQDKINSNIAIAGARQFSHEAMATTFKILAIHDDEKYARQVACEAFAEVDRLEAQLSRFIENSEVSRINNLPANKPMVLWIDTFECLKKSIELYEQTKGAFDVTVGPLLKCWLNKDGSSRTPGQQELTDARSIVGTNLIKLNEQEITIELLKSHVQIDLGGIGKGYAVDCVAKMLRDYEMTTSLISGGGSTVFALNAPAGTDGWPLTISTPGNRSEILARLNLKNRAISSSGIEERGRHIIDPRTGKPALSRSSAWSFTPDAATADALSTAFMVMTPEEIEKYCSIHKETTALIMLEPEKGKPLKDRIKQFSKPPVKLQF